MTFDRLGIDTANTVTDIDGEGGALITRTPAAATWAEPARADGRPADEIIGRLTGAGTGLPSAVTADGRPEQLAVVQQVTPEGPVTRERLVKAADALGAEQEFAQSGRTVRTLSPEAAIQRRREHLGTVGLLPGAGAPTAATERQVYGDSWQGPKADMARVGEIDGDAIVGFDATRGHVRLTDGRELLVSNGGRAIWGPGGRQVAPSRVTAFRNRVPGADWVSVRRAAPSPRRGAPPPLPARRGLTPPPPPVRTSASATAMLARAQAPSAPPPLRPRGGSASQAYAFTPAYQARMPSGFYFTAARKLAAAPDNLFRMGGQHVINWLMKNQPSTGGP